MKYLSTAWLASLIVPGWTQLMAGQGFWALCWLLLWLLVLSTSGYPTAFWVHGCSAFHAAFICLFCAMAARR